MTVVIGMCDICSERGVKVQPALVAWKSPVIPFGNVDRCTDEVACRARVEASGETWPVHEPSRRKAS